MKTVHIDLCPVCSSNEATELLVSQDFLVSQKTFSIYGCPDCGFAFTQDFPAKDCIEKYYDTPNYISQSDTNEGFINRLYHLTRKIALKSKTKLIRKYTSCEAGKLLDIGPGSGYFLNTMRKKKWIVTGIEKSEKTRNYAHKKFGLNIQDSNYLFDMPSKTKDVITMWHTLEHIENLNPTLECLHRILKDNGILVIASPNKKSVDAIHYKESWAAYDVPRHLWHFSPDDLELLAEKHNFIVVETKVMYFDPFYISILSEKYKRSFAAPLVGLIKGFYFLIRSIINTRNCSSIVYILKKNDIYTLFSLYYEKTDI